MRLDSLLVFASSSVTLALSTFSDECSSTEFLTASLGQCRTVPTIFRQSGARKWFGPYDCIRDVCLFHSQGLPHDLILVTTPFNAQQVAKTQDDPATRIGILAPEDRPPFKLAPIPGKGNGLIATRPIIKGEIISREPAMMLIQPDDRWNLSRSAQDELWRMATLMLPRRSRRSFERQMGNDTFEKVHQNGFQMHVEHSKRSGHTAVFPNAARMNHDCRPNANYRIAGLMHITTAMRDIKVGEEITDTYIDLLIPRDERRDRLKKWGFDCDCQTCQASPLQVHATEDRIKMIHRFEYELDNPQSESVTAQMGAQLVQMYEQEKLDIYLGPAYTRAALNFCLFGMDTEARQWAKMAMEALDRQYGPEATDMASMRQIAADPRKHWSWEIRKKMKASQKPKGGIPGMPEIPGMSPMM